MKTLQLPVTIGNARITNYIDVEDAGFVQFLEDIRITGEEITTPSEHTVIVTGYSKLNQELRYVLFRDLRAKTCTLTETLS